MTDIPKIWKIDEDKSGNLSFTEADAKTADEMRAVLADATRKSPPQASEKARELVDEMVGSYARAAYEPEFLNGPSRPEYEKLVAEAKESKSALLSYIADIERERDKARVRCSRTAFKILRSELAAANERIAAMQNEVRKLAEGVKRGDFTYDEIADALDSLSQPTEDAGT